MDLGSGDGRNALFMAEQGFRVTAMDSLPAPIDALTRRSIERGVGERVDVRVGDVLLAELGGPYDNIVAIQLLHFLGPEGVAQTLSKMKEATAPGGTNLITDFAAGSEISRDPRLAQTDYFLSSEELAQCYIDWKVIISFKHQLASKRRTVEGVPIPQDVLVFMARKPE